MENKDDVYSDIEHLLGHGRLMMACGSYEPAIKYFETVLNRIMQGNLIYHNETEEYTEGLVECEGEDIYLILDTYFDMGKCYLELGETLEAKQVFKQLLAIDKTHVKTWVCLGNCYYKEKDYDNALGSYQKALEVETDNLNIMESIGKALANMDRKDEARDLYEQIEERDSRYKLRLSKIRKELDF